MSEALREQRPLLCDDQSEEEHFPEFPRRYRPVFRGRANNTAKGAATIITRWPEHWSWAFTYWWIGLSMMLLTIFAIYNVIIAFALFPTTAHIIPAKLRPTNKVEPTVSHLLPEVFIHFIIDNDDASVFHKYLPYIEIISDKHWDYNFNVILLLNDTTHKGAVHTDEENNENALNSLFSKNLFYNQKPRLRKNIKIIQQTLSQFMNGSPLRNDWRHIPHYLMDFVVKAASIWENGGIAINPEILTPHFPNVMYIEKFQNILNKFKVKTEEDVSIERKNKKYPVKQKDKFKKKVNNIRDIINILEHENNNNDSQETLAEAENVNSLRIYNNGRKLFSTIAHEQNAKPRDTLPNTAELPEISLISSLNNSDDLDNNQFYDSNIKSHDETDALSIVNDDFDILDDNNEAKLGLLPIFLNFLFHDRPSVKKKNEIESVTKHSKNSIQKEIRRKKSASGPLTLSNNRSEVIEDKKDKLVTIATTDNSGLHLNVNNKKNSETPSKDLNSLIIDLKGHLLATKASCHAFVGTIFSTIVHHPPQKTVQDYIVAELSFFCKGYISSCQGIDVILV